MKSWFLVLALGFLISCTDDISPSDGDPIDENQIALSLALNSELKTPTGRLQSEFYYYGPENLQSRTDYYYDSQDREFLSIRIKENDTTKIELKEYLTNGKLDRSLVFFPGTVNFYFAHFLQYHYEMEGRMVEIYLGSPESMKQYSIYTYDELDRITSYRRGTDTAYDLHEYLYDTESSDLISEELYSQSGMTEPFYRYRYDYNEQNLLTSKSLQLLGPDFRPAFEYYYDNNGKLIEEITNDLYFGTVAVERKTFTYYE